MTYLFTSPTASDTARLSHDRGVDRRTDRLMRHVRQPVRGLHVVREAGVWTELSGPLTNAREAAADVVLYGGHTTEVSDAYAAELTSAGFGENLTSTLLTEAVMLHRASSLGGSWVAASGVPNEGTGSTAYDLTVATEAATLPLTNASTTPGDDARAAVTLAAGPAGLSIGLGLGTTDNIGADYGLFTTAPFDLSGSFTFLIDYTPNDVGVTFQYFARQGSPFASDGWHIEDATLAGGFISYVGDAGTFVYNPPTYEGWGAHTATMISGRQQYVFVVNRATGTYRCFRNGTEIVTGITDVSTMGDASADLPLVFGANFVLHTDAFWDRALTDTEITSTLPTLLGVP